MLSLTLYFHKKLIGKIYVKSTNENKCKNDISKDFYTAFIHVHLTFSLLAATVFALATSADHDKPSAERSDRSLHSWLFSP